MADAAAGLNSPFGVAVDPHGNVFVANLNAHQILEIDPTGHTSVFADASDGLFTPIDVVTVSHDHFDHLDVPSLRHIGPEATFVTPLGCGKLLRDAGLPNVIELDRWQEADVHGLRVRLVPAQHFSAGRSFTLLGTLTVHL